MLDDTRKLFKYLAKVPFADWSISASYSEIILVIDDQKRIHVRLFDNKRFTVWTVIDGKYIICDEILDNSYLERDDKKLIEDVLKMVEESKYRIYRDLINQLPNINNIVEDKVIDKPEKSKVKRQSAHRLDRES
jgi:hypothetical protein